MHNNIITMFGYKGYAIQIMQHHHQ
uniref:Uncharacterized protein n=1 Tax=Rhizophora mucronata TaxID=61149 RepID=A0A2P2PTX0_RHIMU